MKVDSLSVDGFFGSIHPMTKDMGFLDPIFVK